ncbi:transmembrane protein 87A-like [Tautogolabrus adspersus]
MASSAGPCRSGPGVWSSVVLLLLLAGLNGPVCALSEPGKWILNVDSETLKKPTLFTFAKTLFNSSNIHLKLVSETCNSSAPVQLDVSWYLRNSHCYNEVVSLDPKLAQYYFKSAEVKQKGGNGYYVFHQYPPISCQQHMNPNTFGLDVLPMKTRLKDLLQEQPTTETPHGDGGRRRRREVDVPQPKVCTLLTEQNRK